MRVQDLEYLHYMMDLLQQHQRCYNFSKQMGFCQLLCKGSLYSELCMNSEEIFQFHHFVYYNF